MSPRAFSLIEVTIAIAMVAVLVTTVLAVLPQGLQSALDAETRTMTGMIMDDVRDRVEGQNLSEHVPSISPLFYDQNGRIVPFDSPQERLEDRMYRVDLKVVAPTGEQVPVDTESLMAVIAELGWPVDPSSVEGELLGRRKPSVTQTFLVTMLTGPDWEEIDPNYEPKIEF